MSYIDRYPHWELNTQIQLPPAIVQEYVKRLEEEKIDYSMSNELDGFIIIELTFKDVLQAYRMGAAHAAIMLGRGEAAQLPFPF